MDDKKITFALWVSKAQITYKQNLCPLWLKMTQLAQKRSSAQINSLWLETPKVYLGAMDVFSLIEAQKVLLRIHLVKKFDY